MVAFGAELGLILLDAFGALADGCEIFVDQHLGFCAFCFGLFVSGAQLVDLLHQFEFFCFERVDFLFVADHLVAKGLVLVVFAGFELLDLEALDGCFASADIELDALELEFAFDERVMGRLHRFVVGCEFALCAGLVLRQFFLILGEGKQAAVTVLEDQQGTDIFEHGKGLVGEHGLDKFFARLAGQASGASSPPQLVIRSESRA